MKEQIIKIRKQKSEISLVDWYKNTEELIKAGFTREEIIKAIDEANLTVYDLTEEKNCTEDNWTLKNIHEKVSEEKYIVRYDNNENGNKTIPVYGYKYLIRSQYQSVHDSEIIFNLFKNKYPWFESKFQITKELTYYFNFDGHIKLKDIPNYFRKKTLEELLSFDDTEQKYTELTTKWKIYQLNGTVDKTMFYLDCIDIPNLVEPNKNEYVSLIVPMLAIINNDWDMVVEANKNEKPYYEYYNPEYVKDVIEDCKKQIKPLESKVAAELKEIIENN